MGAMASQITSLTIVYSTVYSGVDKRKHQSSASMAFVRGIHRWPVDSPHKGLVTRKMFPFDDVIMLKTESLWWQRWQIWYHVGMTTTAGDARWQTWRHDDFRFSVYTLFIPLIIYKVLLCIVLFYVCYIMIPRGFMQFMHPSITTLKVASIASGQSADCPSASEAALKDISKHPWYGANMGPVWGRQDPGGPHIGPMKFDIWDTIHQTPAIVDISHSHSWILLL